MTPALPRITVVTASYNQGQFLERTIRSVLNQRYENLEYLILDGGSTDGSVDIIRRYERQIAYWRSHKDGGQPACLNEGFARATGDLYTYINSDDILLPGSLAAAAEFMAAHPNVDACYGNFLFLNSDSDVIGAYFPSPYVQWIAERDLFLPQQGSFYRAAMWNRLGGVSASLGYAFDSEFWCRAIAERMVTRKVNHMMAGFRKHAEAKGLSASWIETMTLQRQGLRDKYTPKSSISRAAGRYARQALQIANGNLLRRKLWKLAAGRYANLVNQTEAPVRAFTDAALTAR